MAETISMIPDWDKLYRTCYFCHSDFLVKYQLSIGGVEHPICSHCIARLVNSMMNGDIKKGGSKMRNDNFMNLDDLKMEQQDHESRCRTSLINDCKALSNRCWALTRGVLCCFCEFEAFQCDHSATIKRKNKGEL